MGKLGRKLKRASWRRWTVGLASLLVILLAVASLFEGKLHYSNYWGGMVFAPFAILIGLLALYAVVFRWEKLERPSVDKRGRPIRYPGDDIEKW